MRPPEGPGDSGSPGPQPPRRTRFLGAAAAPCRPRSTPGGPRSDSPRPPASQPPPGAGRSEERGNKQRCPQGEQPARPDPARGLRVPRREKWERTPPGPGLGGPRPPPQPAHGVATAPYPPRPLHSPRFRCPPPAEGVDPQRLPHRYLPAKRPPRARRSRTKSKFPTAAVSPAREKPPPAPPPGQSAPRPSPRPASFYPRPRPRVGPLPTPLAPSPLAEAPINH